MSLSSMQTLQPLSGFLPSEAGAEPPVLPVGAWGEGSAVGTFPPTHQPQVNLQGIGLCWPNVLMMKSTESAPSGHPLGPPALMQLL